MARKKIARNMENWCRQFTHSWIFWRSAIDGDVPQRLPNNWSVPTAIMSTQKKSNWTDSFFIENTFTLSYQLDIALFRLNFDFIEPFFRIRIHFDSFFTFKWNMLIKFGARKATKMFTGFHYHKSIITHFALQYINCILLFFCCIKQLRLENWPLWNPNIVLVTTCAVSLQWQRQHNICHSTSDERTKNTHPRMHDASVSRVTSCFLFFAFRIRSHTLYQIPRFKSVLKITRSK